MQIPEKTITIAVDENKQITEAGAYTSDVTTLYRGTEYLLKIYLTNSVSDANAYSLSNTYSYSANIGDIYGSNAAPLLTFSDSNVWNNTINWSNVSPINGTLCLLANTVSSNLAIDLANDASKEYTFQIECNAAGNSFTLCDSTILINNIATEP